MASTEGTISLPLQHVKRGRGKPGYKGKDIDVVNADGKVVGHGQTDTKKARAAKAAAEAEESGKGSKKS